MFLTSQRFDGRLAKPSVSSQLFGGSRLVWLTGLLGGVRYVVVCSPASGLTECCEEDAHDCENRSQNYQPCAQWIERG
jgi:hypothetical protein